MPSPFSEPTNLLPIALMERERPAAADLTHDSPEFDPRAGKGSEDGSPLANTRSPCQPPLVTRDEAIRIAVGALARWHDREHGDDCTCKEGDKFGFQAAAVIDACIAEGLDVPLS